MSFVSQLPVYSTVQKLYNILKNCTFSFEDYNSTSHPFHYSNPDDEHKFITGVSKVNKDEINLIDVFASEVNWTHEMKYMYKMIGNTRQIYFDITNEENKDDDYRVSNTLIFNSVDYIKSTYKHYMSKGQENYTDIAYMYCGMGHVMVASYDSKLQKMFWRPDGGSNGYDRYANIKGLIDMKSEEIECHTFKFMEIFDEFKFGKYEDNHKYKAVIDFNNIDESL